MSKVRQALAPDDAPAHKRPDRRLMRRLWGYIDRYRRMVFVTLLLSLLSGALRVAQPPLTRRIIDVEIARGNVRGVMLMSALLGLFILSAAGIEMLYGYLTEVVGQRTMHDLRKDLFGHLLGLDVVFFDRNPVGRLITRLTSDIGTLQDLFSTGVVTVAGQMFTIVGILAVLLWVDWRLALVVLVSMPVIIVVVDIFRRSARHWYLETRRHLAIMNAYLQENITGMTTVQTFGRERKNEEQFRFLNRDYRDAQIKTIFAYAVFFPAMGLIFSFVVAGVIWFGGHELIAAREGTPSPITFGTLIMFILFVQMLFQPIRELSEKFNLLQSAMASSERIFKLLDTGSNVTEAAQPKPIMEVRESIRFEDVHFSYVAGDPVLKGVSFEIPRGKTVAVVGATGAGKSTLINLLARFYDVESGRILIDGDDIRELELQSLRRLFAVVPQEVFLFSGTVADNVRLAAPDLSDEALWQILRDVGAESFVRELPGGLAGAVSERGGTFSTGQKQLLAFARALAANPQVLILDEATANIDTQTEQLIQEATARLLADRTALVIAHRLSTIQRANNILVMHRGRIHEQGTHEELIRRDGLYRRLYELQYPVMETEG